MSSTNTPRTPVGPGPRGGADARPAAPSGGGGLPQTTLDPVKLIKKYTWLIVAMSILGGVFGVGAFFGLRIVAPQYTAEAIFRCSPVQEDVTQLAGAARVDEGEIDRFMQTQVAIMTSEQIMTAVASDNRLQAEAPTWSQKFIEPGTGTFNRIEASQALAETIKAGVVPNTFFIRMHARAGQAPDAAALVRLAREAYLSQVRQRSTAGITGTRDAIAQSLQQVTRQIDDLNARRARLVRDEELDTLDGDRSEANLAIDRINSELLIVTQSIEASQVSLDRYDEMLAGDTGIEYTDSQRAAAEADPIVANLNTQIKQLEADLIALQNSGIRPGHRTYRQLEAQIDGMKASLEDVRQERLRQYFDAEVDGLRQGLAQLRAQRDDLTEQREELRQELNDLTRILAEIEDIDRQVARAIDRQSKLNEDLSTIETQASLDTAGRISVEQTETVPDRISFPKLPITTAAGILLLGGLTTGLVVLRELMDQRVKGASDVAMIPRTRVLGVIPDTAEDKSGSVTDPGTVFRDAPGSALAESYRQVRGTLLKAMQRQNHHSLLVLGGMPGSGTTTVASNLAHAFVAAEQRVLVIDTNFRRPGLHTRFDVAEAPGLADILAGGTSLADAVVAGDEPELTILPAGSVDKRVYERLGGSAMAQLLEETKADYDVVILDTSPGMISSDGFALANRVDASLLVVRAMGEKRGLVARLKNELADGKAEFMGVLVNAVRTVAGGYMGKNIKTTNAYQNADARKSA